MPAKAQLLIVDDEPNTLASLSRAFRLAGHEATVCDNAAQTCPIFPGSAKRIHWPIYDPAFAPGTPEDKLAAFRRARDEIRSKLDEFISQNT